MLDVHQLTIFLAVAEKLSFTRAAEGLFLTQSAVSHQIANLERSVGCELLTRQGRAVALTAAGREMAQQARRVLGALDETELAVRRAARPGQGRLRIGASTTACQFIIPEALREFRECFPDYSLAVVPGDSPAMVEALIAEQVDLALLIRPERQRQSKLAFHDLFEDELQFLVSPLHPWAKAGRVDRRQLGHEPMVLYGRGSATYRMVENYFVKLGVPLRNPIELPDIGAIKELVKLGLGVSVTAEWVARPEVAQKSLVLLPVPVGKLRRKWCVATLAARPLSVAEKTFLGLCQNVAGQLVKAG
jgi:LysR family transcriptional regulator, low CO2-responsive transcriptional regulator